MRIYAVADIHGRMDRMALIRNTISKFTPDVLVVAGDITHFTNPIPVIDRLNDMPVPVLAIRGNTDMARVERLIEQRPNISLPHLKREVINNICFVGLSGTIPVPFASRICLREHRVIEKIKPILKKESVLIAHPPPWGTLDQVFGRFHAGCQGLRKILAICQPRLLICGHIHERPGTAYAGETLVVNCSMGRTGAGAVIEVDTSRALKVEMLC